MQPVFDIAYKFISLFHGFNKILRDETQCCVNIALSLQANKQVNLIYLEQIIFRLFTNQFIDWHFHWLKEITYSGIHH